MKGLINILLSKSSPPVKGIEDFEAREGTRATIFSVARPFTASDPISDARVLRAFFNIAAVWRRTSTLPLAAKHHAAKPRITARAARCIICAAGAEESQLRAAHGAAL